MTGAFDLRSVAGRFRLVALLEAVSWVGLLVGMYFKYLGSPRTEVGVKVFGMAHGLVFIAFVVTGLLAGSRSNGRGYVVAGVAGEHRAAGQCDFPHMGRSTGKMGAVAACRRDAQPGRQPPKRHDRLVGVTRPRPSVAPVHGRCSRSVGLKQRALPAKAAAAASGAAGGVEITEANLEAEVLVRSSQVPVVVLLWSPRSDASIQLGDFLGEPRGQRRRQVVAGDGQRRHRAPGGADVRRAGRPDRRGVGWRASRCRASRACSRLSSCGAGSTRC